MNSRELSDWLPMTLMILISWSFSATQISLLFDLFFWTSSQTERGKQELPLNKTLCCLFWFARSSSSPRMHPIDHMSCLSSYRSWVRITSGDLYHLEQIWLERERSRFLFVEVWIGYLEFERLVFSSSISPFPKCSGGKRKFRAWPKSQILMWHLSSMSTFPGFKSLCIILAECKNWTAQSMLYIIIFTYSSLKLGMF